MSEEEIKELLNSPKINALRHLETLFLDFHKVKVTCHRQYLML